MTQPDSLREDAALHIEALCHQLRDRRQELGLRQEDLAERVGVDRSSVIRLETGAANPQMSSFVSMAMALNLRPGLTRAAQDEVHPADIVHRGLAYNRTQYPQDGRDRVREATFAAQWEEVNRWVRPGVQSTLEALVPGHTQEQATAAATVVQWLGSQIGFDFLRDALGKCGYELVDKQDARGR